MVDVLFPRALLAALVGWLECRPAGGPAYLIEENRILRRSQLRGRRLRLSDDDRRRLAVRGYRLGRRELRQVATIVTPDTMCGWLRRNRRAGIRGSAAAFVGVSVWAGSSIITVGRR